MKSILLIILVSAILTYQQQGPISIDREEAKKAFSLLTEIRKDPNSYYKELEFEKDLRTSKVILRWNDTLARIAETKAFDMASKNYFSHIDLDGYGINYRLHEGGYQLNSEFVKKKSDNYFESINAGSPSGTLAIKSLIIDRYDLPQVRHRKHLLGIDDFSSNLSDIGIGFCRADSGSQFKTYTCVIIAKHDF